jgi:hypothetical protein
MTYTTDPDQSLPIKVCPHCSVQSQTAGNFCPHCSGSYSGPGPRSKISKRVVIGMVVTVVVIGSATGLAMKIGRDNQVTPQRTAASAAATTPSGPATNEVLWVDDIAMSKSKMDPILKEKLVNPPCNTQGWGITFVTIFNESGTAVASPAAVTADPDPVANDESSFTCRYRATIRVDDAKRYRAERSAGNFEVYADYPATMEYSFVDRAALASNGWKWQSQGGSTKP